MMKTSHVLRRRILFLMAASVLSLPFLADLTGRDRVRTELRIPDIPGYRTLKCDLHTHTVFSDGLVWPTVRIDEAWREGFDAIAITDHLEYLPHKADMNIRFNRSYEIALPMARNLRLELIRGAEITKKMPPGHFNAVFLRDAESVLNDDYLISARTAVQQGAFVFWNHPDFPGNRQDGRIQWHPEHTTLVEEGLLHGIEVANGRDYYPEAHRWCLEKGLTILGTSDIHNAIDLEYSPMQGDRRPMTLVFAEGDGPAAIREALFARRTAVWAEGNLYGEEHFLRPLYDASIQIATPEIRFRGRSTAWVHITNTSDFRFDLELVNGVSGLSVPEELTLAPNATAVFTLRNSEASKSGEETIRLRYRVTNGYLTPDERLAVDIPLRVSYEARSGN